MKILCYFAIVALMFTILACEKVSENVSELSVEFSWEGLIRCEWGNPEIRLAGVPAETKTLKIHMYDHVYKHDHGKVTVPYAGEQVFEMNKFKKLQGPCPPNEAGLYEITIKALDDEGTVIAVGSMKRYFPE